MNNCLSFVFAIALLAQGAFGDSLVATADNLLDNGGFELAGDTEESALGWTGGIRVAGETPLCPPAAAEGLYALALRTTSAPQTQTSFTADVDGLYRLSLKLTTVQLDWVAAVNIKAYLDDSEISVDSAYAFRCVGWNEVVFDDMLLSAGSHTLKLKAVRVISSGDPVLTVDDVRLVKVVRPSPANGYASSFSGIPDGAPTDGLLSQPDKPLCEVGEIVSISAKRFPFGGKVYGATSVTVSIGGDEQTVDGGVYVYRAVADQELTQLTWNYEEVSIGDGNILPNPSFEEETVCSGDRVSNVSPYFTKAWRGGIINRGNGQVYCKIPMVDGTFGMALNNGDGVDAELGAFSSSFDVDEEGSYQLSFFLMARSATCRHCVDVSLDGGDPVCTATPASSTSWTYSSTPGIYLSKGSHTITFAGRRLTGASSTDATTLDCVCLEKEAEGLGWRSSFDGIDDVSKARSALSSPDLASGAYGSTFTVTTVPVMSHHNLYAVESIDVTVGGVTRRIAGNAYQHVFLKDEVTDVKWNFAVQSLLPNPSFEEETVIKDNDGDRGLNGANGNFTKAWTGGQINRGNGKIMCYGHPMADGNYGIALFDHATAGYTSLSCTFDLDGAGLYELSFQICSRGNDSKYYDGTTISVAFDGAEEPLLTVRPTSPRDWDTCTCKVNLNQGPHTIMFRAKSGETSGTVIDNVVLKLVKPKGGLMIFLR